METKELLEKLGLDEREAEIFLCLLELGAQLPQHIARNTGIKRTSLYEIFPEMLAKGVIVEIQQGKRRLFQAVSPDRLFSEYERNYKDIKQNISELTAVYRMQGLRPGIEVYEGMSGIKKLYMRTLESKDEIKSFVQVSKYNTHAVDWLKSIYVPQRIKRGIHVRAIMPEEVESDIFMPSTKEELRVTKKVPWNKYPFRIEGMIQGNRVYFASYEKNGPLVGIMIESKQISKTLAALFDLAWEGADAYRTRTTKEPRN